MGFEPEYVKRQAALEARREAWRDRIALDRVAKIKAKRRAARKALARKALGIIGYTAAFVVAVVLAATASVVVF